LKGIRVPDSVIFQIYKLKKLNFEESFCLIQEYEEFRIEEYGKFNSPEKVIQMERETRQAVWYSKDKLDRPCIIIRPRFHTPNKKNYTLLFAIHMFEEACDL